MNKKPLVRAIVAAMIFLEESSSDEVDPDAAVRGMESIAHELLKFAEVDRFKFIELVEVVASDSLDEHEARFIRNIPQMIGLVE
ncbi:hypothetical protein [Solwaraspora sp. WMMD792]|uniref:hypothetical protein n=1 Tax=Solwaraspora sp. WMMD792 TaxID=3016099 RepID=UPI002415D39E|nr:hypothetical protein [Solwaraspora sp. WMMD792]MDG4771999.1 hypothetical protein [Solwaraspora sp. WMMD792]